MEQNKLYFLRRFATLNEYINAERTNKHKAADIKRSETLICYVEAKFTLKMDKNALYDVECFWTTENNKIDSDNVMFAIKFILDGVVKSGNLAGDGRKNIRNISHKIETTGANSVTVIFHKV